MKTFRTPVSTQSNVQKFAMGSGFLTLGSCFSDAIGERLKGNKISTLVNPFGVIYNPVSIHKALRYAVVNAQPTPDRYLTHEDVHLHYDFHSALSSLSRSDLQNSITTCIAGVHSFLPSCHCIMITYGTAVVYKLKDSQEVVANCHKQPGRIFSKELLSVDEIVSSFDEVFRFIKESFPGMRIILTLSPVRHIRDTLTLNSVSKAVLRVACQQLTEKYSDVEYFPAYEIMMDDLRDYRFYKRDMIHPSDEAEDYIWNTFTQSYFDSTVLDFFRQWEQIQQALQHRPFHPQSSGHQNFLKQTLSKLEQLKDIVNVDEEIQLIRSQQSDSSNHKTTSS